MKRIGSCPEIVPIPATLSGLICPITDTCPHKLSVPTNLLHSIEEVYPIPALAMYEWIFNDTAWQWIDNSCATLGMVSRQSALWEMAPGECCLVSSSITGCPLVGGKQFSLIQKKNISFQSASKFQISMQFTFQDLPHASKVKLLSSWEIIDITIHECKMKCDFWLVPEKSLSASELKMARDTVFSVVEFVCKSFTHFFRVRAEAVRQGRQDEAAVLWPEGSKKISAPKATESPFGGSSSRIVAMATAFLRSEDVRRHWALLCLLGILFVVIPCMSWMFYSTNSLHVQLLEYEHRSLRIEEQLKQVQLLISVTGSEKIAQILGSPAAVAMMEGGGEVGDGAEVLKALLGAARIVINSQSKDADSQMEL